MLLSAVMSFSAFFDESGKFQSQPSISFGGVAAPNRNCDAFAENWDDLLKSLRIETLSMKAALQFERPLSDKVPAVGVVRRIEALLPFIECLRKHMMVVSGVAVKSSAFEASPISFKKMWGNPIYFSFTRTVMEVLDHAKGNVVVLTCDEDPATARQMYELYTRLKQIDESARRQLKAISFADDEYVPALQAADLVASLVRSEARKQFFNESYAHETLFAALTRSKDSDSLAVVSAAFVDESILEKLATKPSQSAK
jgi:hypothetical protein